MGVRVSMPIAQAGEMIQAKVAGSQKDSCFSLHRHDPHLDRESLERIADLFQQQITPMVAIETLDEKPWAGHPRHQSESLLADITGAVHLFGGEDGLLEACHKLLAARGLSGRLAIADSFGAAWGLAHYGEHEKHAAGQSTAGKETAGQIGSLPVESLRLSPLTVATLARLGIERVDQLLQLPRSGLAARLGRDLVTRVQQMLGEVEEPFKVYRAPFEHSQTMFLEYPTGDQKILADRIEKLTEKVRAGLATCQRGALRMTCRLDLSAHPPLTLEIGLFAPTIDAVHLSGLIINQLEMKKLPALVERLTVSVALSGPLRSAQASLFDTQHYETNSSTVSTSGSAISRLVDSLSGRLGRDAVLGVKIEDNPLPEKAFSILPLTGNSVSTAIVRLHKAADSSPRSSPRAVDCFSSLRKHFPISGGSFQPLPEDAMRRPLSLLAEPIPLAVAFENGSFFSRVSSPRLPCRVRLGGITHHVTAHWGPERIETAWWKGSSINREYYRIETDRGLWWWIFRNLASAAQASDARYRWMLHGRFA